MAAFVGAVVLSEVLIGTLKGVYDRTRPPGSLVATTGASFPSGHSIAASVTVVAAVIALVPPGRRRVAWGAAQHPGDGIRQPVRREVGPRDRHQDRETHRLPPRSSTGCRRPTWAAWR